MLYVGAAIEDCLEAAAGAECGNPTSEKGDPPEAFYSSAPRSVLASSSFLGAVQGEGLDL